MGSVKWSLKSLPALTYSVSDYYCILVLKFTLLVKSGYCVADIEFKLYCESKDFQNINVVFFKA